MSIFHPVTATCPHCGASTAVERSASVNADRRPDLREAMLDGSFQSEPCSSCGERMRLPPHLTFLDMNNGQWIMAEPADLLENWPAEEAEARDTYSRSFGDQAPPSGRALGEGLKSRLVFGWPALREKLLCSDLGLDDVTLELTKMAIIRSVDDAPLADETELRLVSGNAETLSFAWVVAETEERLATLPVPRSIYDDIAGDTEAWAPVREKFTDQLLVDLRRFITGPDEDEDSEAA